MQSQGAGTCCAAHAAAHTLAVFKMFLRVAPDSSPPGRAVGRDVFVHLLSRQILQDIGSRQPERLRPTLAGRMTRSSSRLGQLDAVGVS